jgi:oxygen-independent coproporphyrinogen III oxidase
VSIKCTPNARQCRVYLQQATNARNLRQSSTISSTKPTLDICQDINLEAVYTISLLSNFYFRRFGAFFMTVSSQIANPSLTPLELHAHSLAQLDPCCEDYLLYPGAKQFLSHAKQDDYLQAAKRGASYSASMSLDLGSSQALHQVQLEQEIALQGQVVGKVFRIHHLQFRGNSVSKASISTLLQCVRKHFTLVPNCESGLMLALADLNHTDLAHWREHGFCQLQLSVQAGEPTPGLAIVRQHRFDTIRINLCFGSAQQPLLALARTLNAIIAIEPDQIALNQNTPNHEHLCWCIKRLHAAGYYYLGAYFFTKAQDALVRAKQQGRLHRDLQGYTTQNSNNHIGCGPGATSSLGNYYFQNTSQFDIYQHALMQNHLPLARSLSLSMDDLLRRIVMQLLMCQFELSIQALELSYPIRFEQYFAKELVQLQDMVRRGWISIEQEQLQVLPKGELFICQICAIFDRYRD